MNDRLSRRKLLSGIGAGVAAGVAGCSKPSLEHSEDQSSAGDVKIVEKNAIKNVTLSEQTLTVELRRFNLKENNLSSPTTVDYVAILESGSRSKFSKKNAVHGQLQFNFQKPVNGEYTIVAYGESQAGDGDTVWVAHYLSVRINDSAVEIVDGKVQE